jgi:phosphoinositide-3-kinase, regulatory subunit 4
VFDAALQWAMKADKTHFWRGYKKPTKLESPHDSVAAIKKTASVRNKTDEYVLPAFDNRHHLSLV